MGLRISLCYPGADPAPWLAGLRALRGQLAGRRFDVLLNLQLALRAGLLSTLVRADRRIGYDRARSKEAGFDLHWEIKRIGVAA